MSQQLHEPRMVAFAEHKMQAWAWAGEIADRLHPARFDQPHKALGHYLTVSRQAGAGGEEIAQLVGDRLGWEVLDRGLVEQIAARYHLSLAALEMVDETGSNWASSFFTAWLDPKIIPHEKYLAYAHRVVTAAARRGNVVVVGRGATFLLPRERGLAVRIVASERYRLAHVMRKHGIGEHQARQYIEGLERGRNEFVHQFFRRDIADPANYDLVIAVDRFGPEAAADAIVAAWRLACSPE